MEKRRITYTESCKGDEGGFRVNQISEFLHVASLTLPKKVSKVIWALVLCVMTVLFSTKLGFTQVANSPWPMKGHDIRHTAQSQFKGAQVPSVKWKFQTGAWLRSSPAIDKDGTIYIGSSDAYLYAINSDGTIKWKFKTVSGSSSSPAIGSDGTVYFGASIYLYAINPEGTEKWKFGSGNSVRSSPVIATDGTLYIGSDDKYLYAINPNGTVKWKFQTIGYVHSSPAIGTDGTVYVGSADSSLYAVNANGTLKWKFRTGGYIDCSPAISTDGTVYVGSGDLHLYAFNPDGTLKWKFKTGNGSYFYAQSSPAIGLDGTVYVGSNDNHLYAINSDGILKWMFKTEGDIYSSPAIGSDGIVYVGSEDYHVYAVDSNGTLKWKFKTQARSSGFQSSPAIGSDETVYIGAPSPDNNVYAFETASIIVSATNLDFGVVRVGGSKELTLTVSNVGGVPVTVSSITSSSTEFVSRPVSFVLPVNSKQDVIITFSPSSVGLKSVPLTIMSNDSTKPNTVVSLTGTAEDLNLYFHPDFTLKQAPFNEPGVTHTHYLYPPGSLSWKYPLPGDIIGSSYLTSLVVGSLGLDGTNFKAELVLRTTQGEILLGSTEFVAGPAMPFPFQPQRIIRDMQGVDPSSTLGDTLIFRVTAVSGRPGLVTYGAAYGQSYISIPNPLGLPSSPTLALPLDGSTGISTSPTLSWNAANRATSYQLQVSISSNFSTTVVNQSGITETSYSVSELAGNTRYYWRVKAANNGGVSDWSSVWSFMTIVTPPSAPTLATPTNGALNQPITLTLGWNPSASATTYRLQVSMSSAFSTTAFDDSTITMASKQVGPLVNNATYYWRVKAKNAGGSSAWSSVWSFTTIVTAPSAPMLALPANSSTGVSTSLTLSWNVSRGATSYRLQVYTGLAITVVDQSGIADTSYTVSGLANNTTYFWRVSAMNVGGTSNWSNSWSFTTILATPTLVTPSDSTVNQPINLTLQWNPSAGAIWYRLQISTSPAFITTTFDDSTITTTSREVGPLVNNTTYYWRVKARNLANMSAWSSVWNFTTIIIATPKLASPSNGSVNEPIVLTLSWNPATGAEAYRLQVSTDSAFTMTIFDDSTITATRKQIGPLTIGTTFYWRVNAKNAVATSPYSEVWSFTTSEITWSLQTSGTTRDLHSVYFVDASTGWAVGDSGITLKTIDGGGFGRAQSVGNNLLSSVYFVDASTGWAVGRSGTIIKTTDSGISWEAYSGEPNHLNSVYFVDASTGWAVGHDGIILKTTDGGINWTSQARVTFNWLKSVHFVNTLIGWAVGSFGTIIKTTDGGISWKIQFSSVLNSLNSVYFVDASTGWAVGDHGILKTTDGGINWTEEANWTSHSLKSIHFVDSSTGWAVGLSGTIVSTTDGGISWKTQFSGVSSNLNSVYFVDATSGWAVGDSGKILRMTTGGLVSVEEKHKPKSAIPTHFALEQNYPNPFNPLTTLGFALPRSAFVTLKVFNTIGEEVATLIAEQLPAGRHQVQWNANGFVSGVYFYRLQTGDFVETKKLILLR